ncbi:MAG: hypothetical protein Kow0077_06270 [Anaerolineae bacterium]
MDSNAIQERYEYVIRTMASGLITLDAAGRVDHMNPAAAAMLRVTPESCIGRMPGEAFASNHALVDLLTLHDAITYDVRLPKRRLAVGFGTTLSDGGRLVLLQDVTEQRDLDSRREALIRTIAHDLRNPLTALEGYADLVAQYGPVKPEQEKFLARVRQTARKLHNLTASLVELAWIEAGMPLAYVPVQLSGIIRDVVHELTTFARVREVVIAVSTQDPLPIVMGDPARLRQLVYHLLHNAILYSHAEQTVAIHAWQDTEQIFCSVADQGIGIRADEQALIFDRMYRSNDEQVRALPGGGLGLTIARTIVQRHGGHITVESVYGSGSTFTFVLPLVREVSVNESADLQG